MHAPTTTETPLGGIAPFVSQQHYHGNRVAICQECYERADGPQQVGADATSYESKRWIVYCPSVPDDRSVCSRLFKSRSEAQKSIDTWIEQSQKCKYVIAEVGSNARAKLEMPTADECIRAVVDFNDRDYHTESLAWVLRKFVDRRNAKL
jgi:hypothetical protein